MTNSLFLDPYCMVFASSSTEGMTSLGMFCFAIYFGGGGGGETVAQRFPILVMGPKKRGGLKVRAFFCSFCRGGEGVGVG